jgi:hypothetical protein
MDLPVLTPKEQSDFALLEKLSTVLRDYMSDYPEQNHLIEGSEFSDTQLVSFLLMTIDKFNSIPPITMRSGLADFPSLTLLLEGAAIYALKSAVFKYIRNAFQYNDSGVQVAVEEKAAEYERTIQRMLTEWMESAREIRQNLNLESAYGGVQSEYLNLFIVGRRTRKT